MIKPTGKKGSDTHQKAPQSCGAFFNALYFTKPPSQPKKGFCGFFTPRLYGQPSNSQAQEPAAQTHASFLRQNSPAPGRGGLYTPPEQRV
jgi:hypothetical protein